MRPCSARPMARSVGVCARRSASCRIAFPSKISIRLRPRSPRRTLTVERREDAGRIRPAAGSNRSPGHSMLNRRPIRGIAGSGPRSISTTGRSPATSHGSPAAIRTAAPSSNPTATGASPRATATAVRPRRSRDTSDGSIRTSGNRASPGPAGANERSTAATLSPCVGAGSTTPPAEAAAPPVSTTPVPERSRRRIASAMAGSAGRASDAATTAHPVGASATIVRHSADTGGTGARASPMVRKAAGADAAARTSSAGPGDSTGRSAVGAEQPARTNTAAKAVRGAHLRDITPS